jgi:large subunit ribosomal protein L22
MQAISTQKNVRMSPRKLRIVVGMIKNLKPQEAVRVLPLVQKRAAEPLGKVVKSAVANAVEKGANPGSLVFKEIQIGEGPRLKRFRAVSRGQAHSIIKKTSHIRIIVETVEPKSTPKAIKQNKSKVDKKS